MALMIRYTTHFVLLDSQKCNDARPSRTPVGCGLVWEEQLYFPVINSILGHLPFFLVLLLLN